MRFFNIWNDSSKLNRGGTEVGNDSASQVSKRAFVRIKKQELPKMFSVGKIFVDNPKVDRLILGSLNDISFGGLSITLPVLLEENRTVNIGFFLGTVRIISKALVKHIQGKDGQYVTGFQFVDLDPESAGYICGLHASLTPTC